MGRAAEPSGVVYSCLESAFPFHIPACRRLAGAHQKGSLANRIKQSESLPFIPRVRSPAPARQSSEPRVLEPVVGTAGSDDRVRDRALSRQVPFIFKHPFDPCRGMKTAVSTAVPHPAPSEARAVLTSKRSAYLSFLPRH